jgi:hypothetical protein
MADPLEEPEPSVRTESAGTFCPYCDHSPGLPRRLVIGRGKRTIVYECPECEFRWVHTINEKPFGSLG